MKEQWSSRSSTGAIIHQADCLYPSDAREAFVQLLGTLLAEVETARVPK
jgi:hypothetical protein